MENNTFKSGRELGRRHFVSIANKGERWKKRNVPAYIRESLFIPHYMVEFNGFRELYIIQSPIDPRDKVRFILYARSKVDEEECSKVFNCKE